MCPCIGFRCSVPLAYCDTSEESKTYWAFNCSLNPTCCRRRRLVTTCKKEKGKNKEHRIGVKKQEFNFKLKRMIYITNIVVLLRFALIKTLLKTLLVTLNHNIRTLKLPKATVFLRMKEEFSENSILTRIPGFPATIIILTLLTSTTCQIE